ncbi:NEW3 domain-containing protein [Nonomuraea roseoviolacea]|uniref:Alpha-galactosidase NEW3 domain-containing protein n=1 Tax=Nonomuraea roseoviolacea subsp. carminata TaxID=160689 RepID=A0ABT1KC78_9ACTN|nr:NEW3 domain-containing protein [Nonomuraea roseoviolacea]MCP2351617.1 hypothetical protein [Nonomuraea roseoviolacea subsp. carminata]
MRDVSLEALVARVDTGGEGLAVVVANTLSFDRSAPVAVRLPAGLDGGRVLDDTGARVPSVVDRGTLRFLAEDVPATGWRTWRLLPGPPEPAWVPVPGVSVENGRYRVTADPQRGGCLSGVFDKKAGRGLLRPGCVGNELRVYEEYPAHPDFGEGPWHLVPKGPVVGAARGAALVRRESCPLGERLVITGTVDGIGYEQTVTLWDGVDRVELATRVLDYGGADRLLRVSFPADLPGALPVSEVAGAVVGRGFALPDVDAAEAPWTLDNPANTWFGLGSTARVTLTGPDGRAVGERALGVAEVVVPAPDDAAGVRDLLVALVRAGVTATTASADWSRYGWLDVDSNLPDFRIMIGGPRENDAVRELLERAGTAYAEVLERDGRVWVPAARPLREVWRPNADLRDLLALPTLVTTDPAALTADLADARVSAACPGEVPESELLTDHTVALLTYGLPGFAVDPAGTLHLSLLRSCTGWPSGVWIDPPRRTLPDGAGFQLMHGTHEFRYALVSGEGDWRALTLPARGQEFNHPLYAVTAEPHPGPLPPTRSYLKAEPAREVLVGTVKPAGNPTAHGSAAAPDPASGVSVRLMESTGLGRDAVLSGALALTEACRADLLERRGEPVRDAVALTGAEVATVIAVPGLPPGGPSRGGPVLGPAAEAAQPVHARYWLHNRGPAPMGYLPVSVTAGPGLVRTGGEPAEVSVVLSSHLLDADVEGSVEFLVPDGWTASIGRRPYRLAAGGHLRFPVTVTPPAGVGPGMYFAAARLRHDGQTVEDVVTIAVGDPPGVLPVPGDVPEDWTAAQGSKDNPGRDTGLSVDVTTRSVRVAPGGRAVLGVELRNRTCGEIRGELQLVSPWGTWELVAEPVRGFALAAGESAVAEFEVSAPRDAAPASSWALAKVMWFGRCQYAPTVELVVTP